MTNKHNHDPMFSHTQLEVIESQTSHHCFVNREISWLQFNSRVLQQAADPFLPLLERIRFLIIFASNLDEFFMKRVGGLQRQVAAGVETQSADGLTPRQQLVTIRKALLPLLHEQDRLFNEEIRPGLQSECIRLLDWEELDKQEKKFAYDYYHSTVFPLLTPLSVDSGHPFPFISNLSVSIGFALEHPEFEEPQFCRLKVDGQLPQWIRIPPAPGREGYRFLNIKSLIIQNSAELFPGMKQLSWMPFRVTRNVDLEVDDEDAEDLMESIERELRERRSGEVVRLEHGHHADKWILNFLVKELDLAAEEVYERAGLLDYTGLEPLLAIELPRLRFAQWTPVEPPSFVEEGSIFNVIRNKDVLVHHPYESFAASVERFLRESAQDPKVRAIKMTIYRVGQVTPLIPYLIEAAHEGKQVVCLVELKARFDERHNIRWAQELEKAGVHVVYGIPGLKTHAKAILVIRQDSDGTRAYAHCGTGNYHNRTSSIYTDFGLFTSKRSFTRELMDFFNFLTGRSLKNDYKLLLIAPLTMEQRFLELIDREIANCQRGEPSGIVAKMNALEDKHIIEKLYEASCAGVKIDLIVRSACSLRPGVPGVSENIRVISIVGRLLEHSRLFYFTNGSSDPLEGEFYIGSADWMGRNLHSRVELVIPIEERSLRSRLWEVVQIMLGDTKNAWEMQSDGYYVRRQAAASKAPRQGSHEQLQALSIKLNN